jgi:hypothetical protein
MPEADLLATNEYLKTIPIQLKTIRTGSAQLKADDFLDIEFREIEGRGPVYQHIRGRLGLSNPRMPYVFLWLGNNGPDEFFVCTTEEVQELVLRKYTDWLDKYHGIRPKNPKSTHCGVRKEELTRFRDRWDVILNHPDFR